MPALATRSPAPTVVSDDVDLPTKLPDLPDDVLRRFPSLAQWEEDESNWWTRTYNAIQGNNRFVSQSVTSANQQSSDLRVSVAGAVAAIHTETIARITADEILAQRIVTVSAIAGVAQNISVQGSAPVAPVVNDYWVDNSSPLTPITYQWDGAAWNEVTDPISVAAVAAEQTARITADGHLSGKFTLTVIAGNVVTGMNITSSTGGGTDISSVIFRATDFQIYNGVSGKTMFEVSGSDVNLAGTLVVSTSGKVYIGTGTYGNANTAWYVDSTGQFSLKDKLTWNGTTLAISGSITTTSGTIGGWTISTTTITGGSVTLDSTGNVRSGQTAYDTGTGFWIGVDSGTPKMSVGSSTSGMTWDGIVFAVNGTIVSAAGYFGSASTGVAIGAGGLSIGTTGAILGGQTTYNTGVGFFLGYAGAAYKFSIGDPANQNLTWDGTHLTIGSSYLGSSTTVVVDATGLNVGVAGNIRGGQTAWNTGTGFFLGYSSGAYQFSIGDSAASYFTWSGTDLSVYVVSGGDAFNVGSSGYQVGSTSGNPTAFKMSSTHVSMQINSKVISDFQTSIGASVAFGYISLKYTPNWNTTATSEQLLLSGTSGGLIGFSNSDVTIVWASTGMLQLSGGITITGLTKISNSTDQSGVNTGSLQTLGGGYFAKSVLIGTTASASQLISTVATGTAPLVVASTTQVANLNAASAGAATTSTNLSGGSVAATTITASSTVHFANFSSFGSATLGGYPVLVHTATDHNLLVSENSGLTITAINDALNAVEPVYFAASTVVFRDGGGIQVGSAPTGGDKGSGTINLSGDIYKNNTAYTNPDYVLEYAFTGTITKYADKSGAQEYTGLRPLAEVEQFARTFWHLPRFGQNAQHGIFSGSDALLASVEESYLYLFGHERTIQAQQEWLHAIDDRTTAIESEIKRLSEELAAIKAA